MFFNLCAAIIVVAEWFTEIGGQPRNYIARLHPDGSMDEDFNPGVNERVIALAIQADGKIVIGGLFNEIGGEERHCGKSADIGW